MSSTHKTLRYYYWIALEFTKKNLRLIMLSFFLSIVAIIGFISFSPYVVGFMTTEKKVIGMVGTFDVSELPESIQQQVSSGLIYVNNKGEIVPLLANTWEQSKDGKQYRFYLKRNLFWNDGQPFTTKDIVFKFKDIKVTKIDDYVIQFNLDRPLPIFPTYLVQPIIRYPLIGVAGLYKVDRLKQQYGNVKEIDLSPNKADLPFLIYKIYDSESKMINAYKLGEISEMEIQRKGVADMFLNWKNTAVTKTVDYTRVLTLFFNMDNEFLKQRDVRRAIAESISKSVLLEQGEEAVTSIPPTSWAHNPNVREIQNDLEGAQKVLRKSGEATGSATLQLKTYYEYLDTAEKVKDDIQRTGLKVSLSSISFSEPTSFDMLLAFWKVPLDPDQYYFWHSTQKEGNIAHYDNKKIDLLLEQGRNTMSLEDRKKIYYDFQKTLHDDMPAFFIYYPYVYKISRK